MNKVNKSLEEMGLWPAPEPMVSPIPRRERRKFVKVAGESKAARRMRRMAFKRVPA